MESGADDFAMMSPFLAFEAEKSVAFELFNQWVSFVLLVELRLGEYFSDQIRIRHR